MGDRLLKMKDVEDLNVEETYVDMLNYLNFDIEGSLKKMNAMDFSGKALNELMAEDVIEQLEEGYRCEFPANIMLIGDRLFGIAVCLAYFIGKCSNANVLGVAANYQEAMSVAGEHTVDHLIIVGYQKNDDNYRVISKLRERVNPPHVVFWALLDGLIVSECRRYEIQASFDRRKPLREFVEYLRGLKNNGF